MCLWLYSEISKKYSLLFRVLNSPKISKRMKYVILFDYLVEGAMISIILENLLISKINLLQKEGFLKKSKVSFYNLLFRVFFQSSNSKNPLFNWGDDMLATSNNWKVPFSIEV